MRPSRGVRAGAVGKPPLRKTRRPLVGFRGAPRTKTASTWGGHGFHPACPAFQRPSGLRSMRPPARPKPREGPPCAFVPLQRRPSQPRAVPPTRRPARRTAQPLLGFRRPTTQSRSNSACRPRFHPRSSGRVRRFGYLLRDSAVVLPAREAPERPWASPFRAFPPCAAVPPFGGPALVTLPAPAPHREVHAETRPSSGPCSRHGSVPSPTLAGRPSVPSWGFPLQSVRSIRPGAAL